MSAPVTSTGGPGSSSDRAATRPPSRPASLWLLTTVLTSQQVLRLLPNLL